MNDTSLQALLRVASRIQAGEELTGQMMGDEGVPVDLRIVLAAAVLTAADHPVTKKSITTAAPAARSAVYREHADLLELAKTVLPALVQAQLSRVDSQVTAGQLAAQLEHANGVIANERARRKEAETQLRHVISYARELHWQMRPEYEQLIRERQEKVRHLTPVPASDPEEPR